MAPSVDDDIEANDSLNETLDLYEAMLRNLCLDADAPAEAACLELLRAQDPNDEVGMALFLGVTTSRPGVVLRAIREGRWIRTTSSRGRAATS